MNFLNPTAIAIAAALTVPPLIALYFLKLKRAVRLVPSTLLWKKTIEDLRVNAPFQRLRTSLLLLLQLLVLVLGAIALGKPMRQTAQVEDEIIILLIDQSASMGVLEEAGRSRLTVAKEQAKRAIDAMSDNARAMVIAFCDRATVVSSFDGDRQALKNKIDSIEETQSTSHLAEAITLAEAYAQNLLIGTEQAGREIAPESTAAPASLFLFTDGKLEDAERVRLEKFDVGRIHVTLVGAASKNVGVTAMQARRHYERPQVLEVTATVQNFGTQPLSLDAVLHVDGRTMDVKTITLDAAAPQPDGGAAPVVADALQETLPGTSRSVPFDTIEFEGGGVAEVVLQVDDALSADNRAWAIVEEPRRVRVLLVSDANAVVRPIHAVLGVLPVDTVLMTAAEYEAADESLLMNGQRSAFDVAIFDQHSTARLSPGNYMFWGAAPKIDGVSVAGVVENEMIFNWDEAHPVLRHVAVEAIDVFEWSRLKLPPESVTLIDGHDSPVLAHLVRGASQFLIAAFAPIVRDDTGRDLINTDWIKSPDFIVFISNAVQFLGANVATTGKRSVTPGEPVSLPLPPRADRLVVVRPDGQRESVAASNPQAIHYANTRAVGVYTMEPGLPGADRFAVNLFNRVESDVAPASALRLGGDQVEARTGEIEVNQPAWRFFLVAVLALLLLEWVVYNRRVFV